MYFDRGDILDAYYLFFSYYHEGQFSDKYKRLSKMSKYYTPSPLLRLESLSDNAWAIYERLSAAESA